MKEHSRIAPKTRGGLAIVRASLGPEANLGAVADAVHKAQTPHRKDVAPAIFVEVFLKLDEKSIKTALDALRSLKGVDAAGSKPDGGDVLLVKLAGGHAVTVTEILGSLRKAGLDARMAVPADAAQKDAAQKESP